MDAEGIPLEPDKMKEQPLSAKDERSVSPNASKDAGIGHSKDIADQLGPFGSCGDHHRYPSNIYAPQAQAIYYKVSLREATEVYIVHWWQPFRPHSHSFESIYNIQRLAIWRYMEAAFFMDATKGDICSGSLHSMVPQPQLLESLHTIRAQSSQKKRSKNL